jgi:hypothetical protein
MFGYVIANRESMDEEQRRRYKSYYCGVCRVLSEKYGKLASGILSYDMAFLVLVLSSLYEPETQTGSERCAPHPLQKHDYAVNSFTEYAADMTVLLAYHKALDDWRDEHQYAARALAGALRDSAARVAEAYPRQSCAAEACMAELTALEESGRCDPDAAAKCFGQLMRQLFIYREDNWQNTLGDMADALGRFIYILDAFVDLKGDLKHGRYNPLREMRQRGTTDTEIEGILTMLIGECALAFEKLPLVENIDILRNILYSGVWTKFPLGLSKTQQEGGESGDQ